jgi:pyruvyl transferase EpsO
MPYIEDMRERTKSGMRALFDGVSALHWTDFPDHHNVGDSAIALGQLAFLQAEQIKIKDIYCIGTLPTDLRRLDSDDVLINGGGNIGGHYRKIDDHRYGLSRDLAGHKRLIQGPQSLSFPTEEARQEFIEAFVTRRNLRFSGRDREAVSVFNEMRGATEAHLVPDAVHMLGHIPAPAATQSIVVLARIDSESAGRRGVPEGAVDWPREDLIRQFTTRVRWKARFLGPGARAVNPSIAGWERLASMRLQRGLSILAAGETVITDRLHAMLLSLQLGRRVIAVDNNNRKLSKYAETWFEDQQPDLRFAHTFAEALSIAGSGVR